MSTAFWGRGIVGLISSTLLALAMSGPALSEEAPTVPGITVVERLAALQASVADHKRAKDGDALKSDIKLIVVLHGDAAQVAKVRKECVKLLGGLTRGRGICVTVRVAALEGIGSTGDQQGARYITSQLRRMRPGTTTTTPLRTAVCVSSNLCSAEFVDPLLKIVTESKDYTLAAKALEALGHFRECKRKRVKILKTVIKSISKDRPGAKGRSKDPVPNDQYRHTGELARNRWAALARVLPGALARLTGMEMQGADADWWIEYVRDNKGRMGALFVDEE